MKVLRHQFRHGEPALPLRHSARSALQRTAVESPDAEWIDDVLIVISELVQNVSKHTRGPGELTVSILPDAVLVEVGDASTTVPRPQRLEPLRPGGRRLLLIEAISQCWGARTCPNMSRRIWRPAVNGTATSSPILDGMHFHDTSPRS